MLKNPGDRFTRFANDGPMPDNQPSDAGAGQLLFVKIYVQMMLK